MKIKGRTVFHSETGTEGGWWAVQDEAHIEPPEGKPTVKNCKRCYRHWGNPRGGEPEPKPSFMYYRDDWVGEDGTKYAGGYYGTEEPVEGGRTWFRGEEPGSFNDQWTKRGNAASLECYLNGHDWEWVQPTERWSWEGFHLLKNGDRLTIFDEDGEIKWKGEIELVRHPLFTEDAFGMWIHADQAGTNREEWASMFMKEHRCELERDE